MKSIVFLISFAMLFALVLFIPAIVRHGTNFAQSDDIAKLVGDWTGESVCVNRDKFPACKDEHVIYHVSITAAKANTVTIRADKIVNGKPEDMGATDYVYDAGKRTLKGEFQNSRVHLSIEFVVKGNTIEGGMFLLPDRTQARSIKVIKNGS